jgi:hypothetical protein
VATENPAARHIGTVERANAARRQFQRMPLFLLAKRLAPTHAAGITRDQKRTIERRRAPPRRRRRRLQPSRSRSSRTRSPRANRRLALRALPCPQ